MSLPTTIRVEPESPSAWMHVWEVLKVATIFLLNLYPSALDLLFYSLRFVCRSDFGNFIGERATSISKGISDFLVGLYTEERHLVFKTVCIYLALACHFTSAVLLIVGACKFEGKKGDEGYDVFTFIKGNILPTLIVHGMIQYTIVHLFRRIEANREAWKKLYKTNVLWLVKKLTLLLVPTLSAYMAYQFTVSDTKTQVFTLSSVSMIMGLCTLIFASLAYLVVDELSIVDLYVGFVMGVVIHYKVFANKFFIILGIDIILIIKMLAVWVYGIVVDDDAGN